ncbi:hypothetical protein C0993_008384 [Termitomyces sp. T159_Od127]|nr:hypothetical protein C0993_008384 [Termitomyces sp. T159_Od127]
MQKAQALCMALPAMPGGGYLSTVEQEQLFLQLLAAKDAAGALSPNELTSELALEESGACAPLLGLEEDF